MNKVKTDELISVAAKRLFAKRGYDGVSMRILAKESGVGLSSIYHFFADKDILLKTIYENTNRELGSEREKLPTLETMQQMLEQLIEFQFDHIEDVVYVLKYYLTYREHFASLPTKVLPAKSILHVEEVLRYGVTNGDLKMDDSEIVAKARVITHTVNGYLLEYYPYVPVGKEREQIVRDIVSFTMAALHNEP